MRKTAQPNQPAIEAPDAHRRSVVVGDSLYFNGQNGVDAGDVVCHGKHGVTLCVNGKRLPVRWQDVLGHKKRMSYRLEVVDQGEDGAVVKDDHGKRSFLAGFSGEESQESQESQEPKEQTAASQAIASLQADKKTGWDQVMAKSVLFLFKSGPLANRNGLHLELLTDSAGHQVHRWKKSGQDQPSQGRQKKPDDETHIRFFHHATGKPTVAKVSNVGPDGVTAEDKDGETHHIKHGHYAPHKAESAGKVSGDRPKSGGEEFSASEFFAKHNDAEATPESIIGQFPWEVKEKIDAVDRRSKSVAEDTQSRYKIDGVYTPERRKLHEKIYDHFLANLDRAKPSKGEKPTFTILGGRGGSGKSWFEGKVYDPEKAVVLDADAIKQMLPEYDGWNAFELHEESSDIFDTLTTYCVEKGVNLVHDATMKTTHKAVALVNGMKDNGYRVEAHYMHLPRQEAAKRAVQRFMGKTGRYVPPGVVLSNVSNEASFDAVKQLANSWSFRDNNVGKGEQPILVAEGSNEEKSSEKAEQTGKAGTVDHNRQVGRQVGDGLRKSFPHRYRDIDSGSGRQKGAPRQEKVIFLVRA